MSQNVFPGTTQGCWCLVLLYDARHDGPEILAESDIELQTIRSRKGGGFRTCYPYGRYIHTPLLLNRSKHFVVNGKRTVRTKV